MPPLLVGLSFFLLAVAIGTIVFTRWAAHWGATAAECAASMPGDAYRVGGARASRVMTRAVTIDAPTLAVWPWLAQLGRGAGWYSYDFLDNGGKMSARHVVSWIPAPREGDAGAIGYLRRVVPGSGLTWWADESGFIGSQARLVTDVRLTKQGSGSRVVIRMSADAHRGLPRIVLAFFAFIDGVMARRQLVGIKQRVERHGVRASDPEHPETGAREQYQHYEVIYASGERAGTPGKERAEQWHRAAMEAGLLDSAPVAHSVRLQVLADGERMLAKVSPPR